MSTRPVEQTTDDPPYTWDSLRALAAATLLQAVEDIVRPRGRDRSAAATHQLDACAWVGCASLDAPTPANENPLADFCWVCEILGLDETAVRAALTQQLTCERLAVPYSRRRRNLYLSVARGGK